MSPFNVVGQTRYNDVILKTDTLAFDSHSQLIIAPVMVKEKPSGAPRTLTIIAKNITIKDQAEITYDLDGLPGNDPDTPAPPTSTTATKGGDGWSPPGDGNWPLADNGGPGWQGGRGDDGILGEDAPTLEIFVGQVSPGGMKINFKGQDGGDGGNGGDGGKGGDGQKGASSVVQDSWYNGDECKQDPGQGGNGGKGGDAGYPGRGGEGGKGGIVKVFTLKPSLPTVGGWNYVIIGGKGGHPGNPGNPGAGGKGGPQGDHEDPCPEKPEYRGNDGTDGQTMDQIDTNWSKDFSGKDGADGDYGTNEIDVVPT